MVALPSPVRNVLQIVSRIYFVASWISQELARQAPGQHKPGRLLSAADRSGILWLAAQGQAGVSVIGGTSGVLLPCIQFLDLNKIRRRKSQSHTGGLRFLWGFKSRRNQAQDSGHRRNSSRKVGGSN